MRTVTFLIAIVVLAGSIIVALPVSAARRAASNLQQSPVPTSTPIPASTPVPTPVPVPTFVPVAGAHTVQQGEWLYCIGRAYQVQPWAIAQASGIPGPYGPHNPDGYYNRYSSPWNFLHPGQQLTIPFNASTAWYNIPPAPVGPPCAAQFALPAGWPPPQPTPYPDP